MAARKLAGAVTLILIAFSAGCAHAGPSIDFVSRIVLFPNGELVAIAESGEVAPHEEDQKQPGVVKLRVIDGGAGADIDGADREPTSDCSRKRTELIHSACA
jgi:hypothetical protein